MPKEIEKKFLIQYLPQGWKQNKRESIAQGYVFNCQEGVVRVRKKGESYFQTIKGRGNMVREEIEIELSREQFDFLWQHTRGQKISKHRYYIAYQSFLIELDIFTDVLEGLIIAEVEFENEEASRNFVPPDWFGREVTDDARYQNSNLAIHGLPT